MPPGPQSPRQLVQPLAGELWTRLTRRPCAARTVCDALPSRSVRTPPIGVLALQALGQNPNGRKNTMPCRWIRNFILSGCGRVRSRVMAKRQRHRHSERETPSAGLQACRRNHHCRSVCAPAVATRGGSARRAADSGCVKGRRATRVTTAIRGCPCSPAVALSPASRSAPTLHRRTRVTAGRSDGPLYGSITTRATRVSPGVLKQAK